MEYKIRNKHVLTQLLWLDSFLGSSNGIIGILFCNPLSTFFGLSKALILWISWITLIYGLVAFGLARSNPLNLKGIRILIYANWFWVLVSFVLIGMHFTKAHVWGQLFLILQIIVVGGLAYLEENQLVRE